VAPLVLTQLNIYPLKSAAGIPADRWAVDAFGLRYDRRWMLVDETGQFISQRECPRLALLRPTLQGGLLSVVAPGQAPLQLPLRPSWSATTRVTVWDDPCEAAWLGERAADWFSTALGRCCSLVYMPDEAYRPADPTFAPSGTRVSFADGFPFLMISEESLADLNSRMPKPVPMNRFRPNLVIAGGEAYVEDSLGRFAIGELSFRVVKPCARCVLTTTDQATGRRGREPLRTLATYRRRNGEVLFGQNVVHSGRGILSLGDHLEL
jgi:uncharacterized protein YcbX